MKETIIFSKIAARIWVQEVDDDTKTIIGPSVILDSFGKDRLEFLVQESEKSDTTLQLEKDGDLYVADFKEGIEIWRENHSNVLNLRLMDDFLDTDDTKENILEEYIKKNLGKECEYFGEKWIICGITDKDIILGSEKDNGYIKEFSDNIMYRKGFKSYMLGKIKQIKLCMS